jgi:hypothetical protein
VRIDLEGELDAGVPGDRLDHVGLSTQLHQQRNDGMPKIVKPPPGGSRRRETADQRAPPGQRSAGEPLSLPKWVSNTISMDIGRCYADDSASLPGRFAFRIRMGRELVCRTMRGPSSQATTRSRTSRRRKTVIPIVPPCVNRQLMCDADPPRDARQAEPR